MVKLEKAQPADIPLFLTMEQAADTATFIIPYSYDEHLENMADSDRVYLRILNDGVTVGFFILALEADGLSVEFRRIVVSAKNKGIGQNAIACMERFCRTELGRTRIWLDVFEFNHRGRHIYEKLGYKRFGESLYDSNTLFLYEKYI